jgi:hypothetical protein
MSLITSPTKVTLEGHGLVTVRPSDYVTQGGEGAIYRKDKHIIKLYLDPQKMVRDGMTDKVRLLAKSLTHPSIVAPRGIVTGNGQALGYYMPYVSGEAYPKLFTNDGRAEVGFTDASAKHLAREMQEVIAAAHSSGALLVDGNELNWLADVTDMHKPKPYAIDVDSWQIDRFKASVIMPSIRDWHSPTITEATDWFAWGIVTFLLFTGIHPYRGTLPGYKPSELERRMRDNASVFNPAVRLNKTVRDFSVIPGPLRTWYEETFERGLRTVPPSPFATGSGNVITRTMRMVTTKQGGLAYEKLFDAVETITSLWPCGLVRTASGKLFDFIQKREVGSTTATRMAAVKAHDGWLLAELQDATWKFRFLEGNGASTTLSTMLDVRTVFRSGERLFAVTSEELVELKLMSLGKPLLILGHRWSIMSNSAKWYRGVGIADLLGSYHLIIPSGTDGVTQVKVPELNGTRIIGAVGDGRFVAVMTVTGHGNYETLRFIFTSNLKSYQVTRIQRDEPSQNLVVLPKGVVAEIINDGELSLLVPQSGEQKLVNDKDIVTTMHLARCGNQVVYTDGSSIWTMRMS